MDEPAPPRRDLPPARPADWWEAALFGLLAGLTGVALFSPPALLYLYLQMGWSGPWLGIVNGWPLTMFFPIFGVLRAFRHLDDKAEGFRLYRMCITDWGPLADWWYGASNDDVDRRWLKDFRTAGAAAIVGFGAWTVPLWLPLLIR